MNSSDIAEIGIMPMLTAVLGGEISENSGPATRIKSSEKQRGIITSPVARRLFTANSILAEHIDDLVHAHGRLHENEEGGGSSGHDCEAFHRRLSHLSARVDILRKLQWQAITEEFPEVVGNDVSLRKGWLLVSGVDEWNDAVPTFDKSTWAGDLIPRLTEIVSGKFIEVNEDELTQVGKDEEVIGSLNDTRVQTLRYVLIQIRDELSRQLPSSVVNFDSKALGKMTVSEVTRLQVLSMHYRKLSGLVNALFWRGIRDTVPAAAELPSIGIRRAWEVVKCVPDSDEEDVTMVMTPMGPAISIRLAIPGDLMRSFMGRAGSPDMN